MNNVVIVSDEQQRDSAIYLCVSVFLQTPLPSRLPHNIEQRSLCCTEGPCWLSILNTAVCARASQTAVLITLTCSAYLCFRDKVLCQNAWCHDSLTDPQI